MAIDVHVEFLFSFCNNFTEDRFCFFFGEESPRNLFYCSELSKQMTDVSAWDSGDTICTATIHTFKSLLCQNFDGFVRFHPPIIDMIDDFLRTFKNARGLLRISIGFFLICEKLLHLVSRGSSSSPNNCSKKMASGELLSLIGWNIFVVP